jgi:ABC-2 type transport system ATP-binding protein
MTSAIELRGVVKRFGRRVALAGVDLVVPRGAVYVLVGPNGAGKTTALRSLLDLVRPDAGEARVHGFDSVPEGARVGALSGYLPERPAPSGSRRRSRCSWARWTATQPRWEA